MMNGYDEPKGEDPFAAKSGIVSAFDAFRMLTRDLPLLPKPISALMIRVVLSSQIKTTIRPTDGGRR